MRADTRILTAAELDRVSGGWECRTGKEGINAWLRDVVSSTPRPPRGAAYGAGQMGADIGATVAGATQA